MINSFGRSHEATLQKILPAYKPLILKKMPENTMKEALLILSGIASEATTKNKPYLDPIHYNQIYSEFQLKCLKEKTIHHL